MKNAVKQYLDICYAKRGMAGGCVTDAEYRGVDENLASLRPRLTAPCNGAVVYFSKRRLLILSHKNKTKGASATHSQS